MCLARRFAVAVLVTLGLTLSVSNAGATQATAGEAVTGFSHQQNVQNVSFVAHPTPPAASSSYHAVAVQHALSKVGSPYRWGGNGPNVFDCSGLVNWAFEKVGVELPRTSRALSQVGTPVSRDNLQPGDLVFFYDPVSHVGIYIGDGLMVHASNSSKPVAVDALWGRDYNSARRI